MEHPPFDRMTGHFPSRFQGTDVERTLKPWHGSFSILCESLQKLGLHWSVVSGELQLAAGRIIQENDPAAESKVVIVPVG